MDLNFKNRRSTSLVWYKVGIRSLPKKGTRVLTCSYDETGYPWIRVMDAQFIPLSKDVMWWAYIVHPNEILP